MMAASGRPQCRGNAIDQPLGAGGIGVMLPVQFGYRVDRIRLMDGEAGHLKPPSSYAIVGREPQRSLGTSARLRLAP